MNEITFEVWVNTFYDQLMESFSGKMYVKYKEKSTGKTYTLKELSQIYDKRI